MIIYELEQLISKHGDVKISELISRLKGNKIHQCPKCNGLGYNKVKYNAYPSGLPDSGWVEDWRYKDVPCDVCDNFGYTEKELKPVTKIIGYK